MVAKNKAKAAPDAQAKSHHQLQQRISELERLNAALTRQAARTSQVEGELGGEAANRRLDLEIAQPCQAEEARQRREQDFRLLAETIPQLVWIARPDGFPEYCNQRWYDYTFSGLDSSPQVYWNQLVHPDDQKSSSLLWGKSLQTGEPFETECRLRNGRTGEYHWFLNRALAVRDAQGNILKMDFSRIQNRKLDLNYTTGADLTELVGRVVEQRRLAEPDRQLRVQVKPAALPATIDEARLEQVLDNLINNALKYSPPATPVTVGLERTETGGRPEALFWVRDQGCGISAEDRLHIFDRFYRVRSQDTAGINGLGLGLYVSHEIIGLHGGRMWLDSEPGQGSTFYFAVPLEPAAV